MQQAYLPVDGSHLQRAFNAYAILISFSIS